MKKLVTLLSFILLTTIALAQRSEGVASVEVEGRTLAGTMPKLTTKGVVDGKVVISVKIDWYGNVSEATAMADESTITNESVINAARSAALRAHFNTDANGQAAHPGTITYTFVSTGKEQTDETALKFMGIPVDGDRAAFMKELRGKGFRCNEYSDQAEGLFNGEEVKVIVSTNHGVVDRVKVLYPDTSDSNETRVKYNNLLSRMDRNAKYVSVGHRDEIPAGESVDWNSGVNSKLYDAAYFYLIPGVKPEEWVKDFHAAYKKKYTKPVKSLSYEELEDVLFCLPMKIRNSISGIVWLAITDYGHININYDNLQNRPRGEDL